MRDSSGCTMTFMVFSPQYCFIELSFSACSSGYMYSCFDKGVQQKCKSIRDNAYWYTCMMGSKFGTALLRSMVLSRKEGENMNTGVCAVSFYILKHLELQSWSREIPMTHNHFRHCWVTFSFLRQPFSKQLYFLHSPLE